MNEEHEAVNRTNDQANMCVLDANSDNNSLSKRATADLKTMKSPIQNNDESCSSSRVPQHVIFSQDVPMTDATDSDTGAELVDGSCYNEKAFMEFLAKYTSEDQINKMLTANGRSVEVDCNDFSEEISNNVAEWIRTAPELVQRDVGIFFFKMHPNYKYIHQKIFLRIKNYGHVNHIHSLRQVHLDTMIRVRGVVIRRTMVLPQLLEVTYNCNKCGAVMGPIHQNSSSEVKVANCADCLSKGPFGINNEKTLYRNYQQLTLQDSPGTVPAGRLPRYKEVILLNDLVDCAYPGEEIEVTGVYTTLNSNLNVNFGIPLFPTVIEANYIGKESDKFSAYNLTQKDKEEIWKLSAHPHIAERIFKSIAPSIYGHEHVKTAIALAMFGGSKKVPKEGDITLRGDINVLLLGDSGTAKSQLLKFVEKTADRAVYTTGKGTSSVGLTVAVRMDPVTRQWTLDVGALALADKGVCLIDELDAMNRKDRGVLHEAMEQQTMSISKAGIVTYLQARCAIIAAASPIGGRYNSLWSAIRNVDLEDSLISRFDLICVIKDKVDANSDDMLAKFVVDSHLKSQTKCATTDYSGDDASSTIAATDPEIIPQDLLKKYIRFAKLNVFPKLLGEHMEKLTVVYAELRRMCMETQIVPRHLEAMIRMSEAHARMHLRHSVTEEDMDMAIRIFLKSFISTQTLGSQVALEMELQKFMTIRSGVLSSHSSLPTPAG